jgi:hypothetical protein
MVEIEDGIRYADEKRRSRNITTHAEVHTGIEH